jgi:hypothetical protein
LEAQRPLLAKAILNKKQCWSYHNTWLQTILQIHSNKNSMILVEKQTWGLLEQSTRPRSYAHLIFDKGAKNIPCSKDSLFSKCCWENWLSACRELKLDPCLSLCTSINTKWIKDLNIRPETLKLVQERAGNTLEARGISNNFLNRT